MQSLEADWFKEHRVLPVDAEDITWNDLMTCSRKTHLEEYDGCVKNAILCGEEQKERSPSMCESLRDMSTVNVFVE